MVAVATLPVNRSLTSTRHWPGWSVAHWSPHPAPRSTPRLWGSREPSGLVITYSAGSCAVKS